MARFVLVAGAWHGAWCWEFVVPLLTAMGHRAETAELPGMGADRTPLQGLDLPFWSRAVAETINADPEPVILVGHSRGGIVVSQTAELVPKRIRLAVYLTAILMRHGESALDSSQLVPAEVLRARAFEPTGDGLAFQVLPDLALSYGRSPPELVERALERMTPEPRFALVAPLALSPERYGRVRRAYVECLADETVPLVLQRAMQSREPCEMVRSIDTDHCPTYSAPEQVASVLHGLADQVEFCALKGDSMSLADTRLDVEVLRAKYREERDKRLKVQERSEYVVLSGSLAERFDTDVWAHSDGFREPVVRELEALIVGGGFAGMLAAGNLRKHGVAAEDVCIVERGSDFGGTWYWNRYPGLSCDTEAYCYMPLLEETGYVPKEKYARGPELLEHSQRIGRHFGLYDKALFQTKVTEAEWNENAGRWIIGTDRGDELRARYLWLCAGATNRPKLPGVPGIEDFAGHSFHTMRWDYSYTGGSPEGDLSGLADKRVGVIGTGCTAIQCVPPLARHSKELFVFQRTPSAVNERANRPTSSDWATSLHSGWQMARMENFLNVISGVPEEVDLVDDAWTWSFKNVRRVFEADSANIGHKDSVDLADFARMESVRARIDRIVQCEATAEALKPWYGVLCKRPTFHDEYLQAFNRDNVTLVDTRGAGVERITKRGVVANGKEYPLDCIIFSTGFDVTSGIIAGLGFDPKGVGDLALSDRFKREFSTLHGMLISGFPNMFMIGGAQGTLATTRTYDLTIQSAHCARIMEHSRERGAIRLEVRPEAEAAWQVEMADKRVDHDEYFEACTPGYLNLEGKGGQVYDYYYGAGPVAYRRQIERWFAEQVDEDLVFGPVKQ